MTIQELFIRSNHELRHVINHIRPDQWDMPMPEDASSKPTLLIAAVNYHAYDDAWVPDVLAGKTKDQIGNKYESVLTAEKSSVLNAYNEYNAIASQAVRDYDDLAKIVHLSYGDFSAHDYLRHITIFRAFRSYDIAKMIGSNTTMSEDFVQALWEEYTPLIEGYRQMGVFPASLEVPADANLQTKLLALVGRS